MWRMRTWQSGIAPTHSGAPFLIPKLYPRKQRFDRPPRSGICSRKIRYRNHIPFLKSVQLLNHQTALFLGTERHGLSVSTVNSEHRSHSHTVHWLTMGTVLRKRPYRVRTALSMAFPNSFHQHTFTENSLTLSNVQCKEMRTVCRGNGSLKWGIWWTWRILHIHNGPDTCTEHDTVLEHKRNGIHLNESAYTTYNPNAIKLNNNEQGQSSPSQGSQPNQC